MQGWKEPVPSRGGTWAALRLVVVIFPHLMDLPDLNHLQDGHGGANTWKIPMEGPGRDPHTAGSASSPQPPAQLFPKSCPCHNFPSLELQGRCGANQENLDIPQEP